MSQFPRIRPSLFSHQLVSTSQGRAVMRLREENERLQSGKLARPMAEIAAAAAWTSIGVIRRRLEDQGEFEREREGERQRRRGGIGKEGERGRDRKGGREGHFYNCQQQPQPLPVRRSVNKGKTRETCFQRTPQVERRGEREKEGSQKEAEREGEREREWRK